MLLSFIVPVYNTPATAFERCINSILKQNCDDFEILVIDDGSEENLAYEYKEICGKDRRIHYEWKTNSGVCSARNRGVESASGEFVAFVDADDEVKAFFAEHATKYAKENNADLVVGKIKYIPESGTIQCIPDVLVTKDKKQILEYMFLLEDEEKDYRILGSPCGRLYRSSIAKEIFFDAKIRYWEDQIYNREFIKKSSTVVLVPEDWYDYYQNEYSAMHRIRGWGELQDYLAFWDKWNEMNHLEENRELKILFYKHFIIYIFKALREGVSAGEGYRRNEILKLLRHPAVRDMLETLRIGDFRSLRRKLQFWMIKNKFTLFLYFFIKMKMKHIGV